jgi:hypothetical protein
MSESSLSGDRVSMWVATNAVGSGWSQFDEKAACFDSACPSNIFGISVIIINFGVPARASSAGQAHPNTRRSRSYSPGLLRNTSFHLLPAYISTHIHAWIKHFPEDRMAPLAHVLPQAKSAMQF